jgi:hypothetical protein
MRNNAAATQNYLVLLMEQQDSGTGEEDGSNGE